METFDAISKRASVRDYSERPVDKKIIEKLVDAGRRAPTARAVEPWEFLVVTDKKELSDIAALADTGRFIGKAACCIAVFSRDTKYYLEDGCAATENILLAAADLGLGACWVAGDKKPYAQDVSKLLKASPDLKLVSLISIGWPKGGVNQHKNRTLREVIHWQRFGETE